MSGNAPLDPGHELRDEWIRQAVAFIHAELDGLEQAPAHGPGSDELLKLLAELPGGVPEEPVTMSQALDRIGRAARLGLQPAGPGYLAYIPGGGIFASALAGFISLSLNRFVGLAAASPGMVRLEQDVVSFFVSELGMPTTASGILTSGGSISNLSAIVAARVHSFGDSADFSRATIYLSGQAHRSVAKAARMAGIPPGNLRFVPVDRAFRIEVAALADRIAKDREAGLHPFLVVASAGTTNTGAIDPLVQIAGVCRKEGVWFHVDGAYGGMFVLTEEGRGKLKGIELADSVTLDPHKGLFLPYGCGALIVRDPATLVRAHSEGASYLQDLAGLVDGPSPADMGPELSRNDRGILVWLPLALHGVESFRRALEEKLELTRVVRRGLSDLGAEVPVEPELSVIAFRLPRRDNESLQSWNDRNRAWLERINDRRRIHLSSTMLPGADGEKIVLRMCILSFRTGRDRINQAMEDLTETAAL